MEWISEPIYSKSTFVCQCIVFVFSSLSLVSIDASDVRLQRSITILSDFNAFRNGMSNYFQWQQVYAMHSLNSLAQCLIFMGFNVWRKNHIFIWECMGHNSFTLLFIYNVMQLENKGNFCRVLCFFSRFVVLRGSHQRDFEFTIELNRQRWLWRWRWRRWSSSISDVLRLIDIVGLGSKRLLFATMLVIINQ